jgi:hypothetical protein
MDPTITPEPNSLCCLRKYAKNVFLAIQKKFFRYLHEIPILSTILLKYHFAYAPYILRRGAFPKYMPHRFFFNFTNRHIDYGIIFRFTRLSRVGRIFLHARHINVLTAFGICEFQIPFQIGLSSLLSELSAWSCMESSLARWYALRTVNIPNAIPLHIRVSVYLCHQWELIELLLPPPLKMFPSPIDASTNFDLYQLAH